jgi:hypothetical protein
MGLLTEFLAQLRSFVRAQDGDQLRAWLQVAPGAPQQYYKLAAELKAQFGNDAKRGNTALETAVEKGLPDEDVPEGQGTSWPGLVTFVKDYMGFWRDVDFNDLQKAHSLLSGLVK